MSKTCNGCGNDKSVENVPYIVHESGMTRLERQLKRLWIVILVLICLLVGSNCAWLYYESQFEDTTTYEEIIVDSEDDGIANYIGQDGDIYNGEDSSEKSN